MNFDTQAKKEVSAVALKTVVKFFIALFVIVMALFFVLAIIGESSLIMLAPSASELFKNVAVGDGLPVPVKLLIILPLLVPVVFAALFMLSIVKVRKNRFNLAFIVPMVAIVLFTFIMSIVSLFSNQVLEFFVFMAFEIVGVLILLIYNMIDNRQSLNLKLAAKRVGIVGLCMCMLALPFTASHSDDSEIADEQPSTEINVK